MHKLSANLSDQSWDQLREIQYMFSKEDKNLIISDYSISDILNMIIDRAYRSTVVWYESNKSDSSLNKSLTNS